MALSYERRNFSIVLFENLSSVSQTLVPDELSEEVGGITNDASRPGLLVLAELQSQPVIHMALKRQDSLYTS